MIKIYELNAFQETRVDTLWFTLGNVPKTRAKATKKKVNIPL